VLQAELVAYREMVEEAANAIFLTDETGEITYVNESFEELIQREEMGVTDQKLWEIDIQADTRSAEDSLANSVRAGSSWDGEVRLQFADEDDRTVNLTVTPIEEADTERFVGVGTDVTEERNLRDRVKQQRNDQRLLNRILRHDIRNDVQVLIAATEQLRGAVGEEHQAALDQLLEKCSRIDDLTRTAADISSAIGTDDETVTGVAVDDVLQDEVADLRRSFDADVSHSSPPTDPTVRADEMLSSLFGNLLQNAVQHNDAASVEIEIATEVTAETVTIRIADDGRGIPDEQKARLFEYGEQGPASSGSGIGLFLVDMLVDKYDGEIHIEDNDPTGSVFVVELPRTDAP
jgi:PAS domain S-box-containing protein